jgi:L-iditol 2-dehydrogenase
VEGFHPGTRITGDPNIVCGRCAQCHAGRINLCRNLRAIGIHRDGGLAEYVLVPQKQAYVLPQALKAAHGAFCEPLACCLHGVDLAAIKPGSSVVVLGGGVIGLLVVQLAKLAGAASVVLSTRQAAKRRLAEEVGATGSIDPSAGDFFNRMTGPDGLLPGGADVVIECAGVVETVQQSFQLARPGGTIIILGVMPQGVSVQMEPFDLLFRELKVFGSFINPFTHKRAADLVSSGAIELDKLISRQVGLEELPGIIANPAGPGDVKTMYVAA